jgi:hypothetical protein
MMAEWPNDGQLPQFTDPSFFDAGSGFPLTQDGINVNDQSFAQSFSQPLTNAPNHQEPYSGDSEISRHQPYLPAQHATAGPTLDPSNLSLEAFFMSSGGWRPPEPCDYCRRMRLQCFMLQTTEANPNPVTSCSSCVALFRQCSLAERAKRHHSAFETSAPVIGQLHGVSEEDGATLIGSAPLLQQPQTQPQS